MPCHRTHRTAGKPGSSAFVAPRAEGQKGALHGIPLVALGAATEPGSDCSPLGGQAQLSSVRIGSLLVRPHTGEQQEWADLSKNLENPSRGEQIGACVMIVLAIAVPLALLFVGAV
jgi:hypothetical protein